MSSSRGDFLIYAMYHHRNTIKFSKNTFKVDSLVFVAHQSKLLYIVTVTNIRTYSRKKSCEIYTEGERGSSPSRNGKITISNLKSSLLYQIVGKKRQVEV